MYPQYDIGDAIMAWRAFVVWGHDLRLGLFLVSPLCSKAATETVFFFNICREVSSSAQAVLQTLLRFSLPLKQSIVVSFVALHRIANISSIEDFFTLRNYVIAYFVISVATQMFSASMIAWKIWRSSSWRTGSARRQQMAVLWLILESGCLLAFASVVDMVLFCLSKNAGQMMPPIMGQLSVSACRVRFKLVCRISQVASVPCANVHHRPRQPKEEQ